MSAVQVVESVLVQGDPTNPQPLDLIAQRASVTRGQATPMCWLVVGVGPSVIDIWRLSTRESIEGEQT